MKKEFYTSVELIKSKLFVKGYDDLGKRFVREFYYRPYLFIPTKDKNSKFSSVHNQPVERMDFQNVYEAREFLRKYKDIEGFNVFGLESFEYNYIYDQYPGTVQFDIDKIRTGILDIEVDSKQGFPNIDDAVHEVTAITLALKERRFVFGLKDFDQELTDLEHKDKIHYFKCKDEKALLRAFLTLWESLDLDAVTGWYIEFFDLPYLVNRLTRVFSRDEALRLSPFRSLREKTINSRGKEYLVFYPRGIAVLDYLELYKKFTYSQRESYTLNYIAHVEINEKKTDYSEYTSLNDLYEKNPQKFFEYNIKDTDLIQKLDDKLKFLELVFTMAYDAKVKFEDTLGSVHLWDVLIHGFLRDRNKVVSPKPKHRNARPFEGAYVKNPMIGMHKWVMSFDLTSLYPHLIMQYNISPDTFATKLPMTSAPVHQLLEGSYPEFDRLKFSMAANGCLFKKERQGFLASIMENQFKLRDQYKKKMIELKKEKEKNKSEDLDKEISKYHNFQLAKKIQLNSLYGSVTNEWFRWYNADYGEAVTLSGQLVIQTAAKAVNDFINTLCKTEEVDYIIAADTDSLYISLDNFMETQSFTTKREATEFLENFAKKELEPIFKACFDKLAQDTGAFKNAMHMKLESIIDKAIWRAKKNYIANILYNEGVYYKEPELKTMGIETVRASTPEICRNKLKEVLKIIINEDIVAVRKFVDNFKKEFMSLPFEEIAFPRSVKDIDKWVVRGNEIYKLGTPIHVKAAILHNKMVKDMKLTSKYNLITSGDKIKFMSLKVPNPLFDEVIGAIGPLPKEFGLDKYIDYKGQFEKSFLGPLTSILDVIGWELVPKSTLEAFIE